MNRTKWMIVLLVFASITILSGCGRRGEQLEGNGEIFVDKEWDMFDQGHLVDRAVEIDFWSANSAVDVHGSTMATLVQQFNAYQQTTYPDSPIRVNISFQGGYVNQNSKLQAALIGRTNPDIAMVGVSSMALYVDNALDMRRIFTYEEIENIFEGFLQFAMYRHKFVAYPYFGATNLFVVNRTLMDATGIEVPTVDEIIADLDNSTWTWELFEEVVMAMRDTSGGKNIYGAAINNIPLYEAFFTQGVNVYNEMATAPVFNNEQGIKAFTFWQNMVKNGYILNPVLDPNHGTKIQADFANGNVGLLFESSSIMRSLFYSVVEGRIAAGTDPLFDMDVLPHPKDTHHYSNQSGGGLIVFNNRSNLRTNAAVEFLRWLQADDQMVQFSTSTGYLATTKSATSTDAWLEYKEINPLLDRAIQLMRIPTPEGTRVPIGRAKALADDDLGKYSRGIFYDQATRDVAVVLKDTFDRVAYILDTNK